MRRLSPSAIRPPTSSDPPPILRRLNLPDIGAIALGGLHVVEVRGEAVEILDERLQGERARGASHAAPEFTESTPGRAGPPRRPEVEVHLVVCSVPSVAQCRPQRRVLTCPTRRSSSPTR